MLIAFYMLSGLMILSGILPQIRRDHWTFRVFEFPRVQKLILALICLSMGVLTFKYTPVTIGLMAAVAILVIYLFTQILPFSPLGIKSLKSASKGTPSFKLLIANVLQYNNHYEKLNDLIEREQPELILALETDRNWQTAMHEVTNKYPHRLEKPLDNTYGMLFYSQYEMINPEIRYITDAGVPSIRLGLSIPGKSEMLFYGLHPPPPSPTENSYSTERDYELLKVAKEIKSETGPVIVAGDLNDVAWSFTTTEFLKRSGLKDPRKGRGIYATYNAKNILMRWPLDHIFCSDHFRLAGLKRLPSIDSDHFPILVELALPNSSL